MKSAVVLTALVAAVLVSSLVALPLLGGDLEGLERGTEVASDETDGVAAADAGAVSLPSPTVATSAALSQDQEDAVERGVDEGIELVQSQGVEVSQEQRATALEGARTAAAQNQEADVEQTQAATAGAVHGALVQEQRVDVSQLQVAIGGATGGALAQHQRANATQLQSATWGATHGALANAQTQSQEVTLEQVQVAASGAAAGAAHEAGEKDVGSVGKVQEAAQGSAYGVLEQYQKLTVEQRQRVTIEHAQHAAAGAAAGALEGSSRVVLEQEQRVEIEQYQRVTIKQVQTAAMGAAKGALVQKQEVTVEQTQSAARGAAAGSLVQLQLVRVEQVQRITITQLQEAAFGASKGAIVQSQEATVEQIQAAARGAAGGTLVQHQEVSVMQVQRAATGAATGAVDSAVQHQVVDVEQIQAAAHGAGVGAVTQVQVVNVLQVQVLARGASSGALSQAQTATVEQIQLAATSACEASARQTQVQRVSVTQLQSLTADTAAETAGYAAEAGLEDESEIADYAAADAVEAFEAADDREGTATVTLRDQEGGGETVVVDRVDLSDGGFVAIHDETIADDPVESVVGVSGYLEPGTHEDVEIELEDPLEESQSVVAVAHLDTDGDEAFGYVETDGAEDEPYVGEGGAFVHDRAFVALEADDGTPEEPPLVEPGDPDDVAEPEEPDLEDGAEPADPDVGEPDAPELEDPDDAEAPGAEDPDDAPEDETEEPDEPETPDEPDAPNTSDESDASDDLETPPEATLSATDQEGDGETLVVEEANASVDYVLSVTDGAGERRAESETFAAGEAVENLTLELSPPLEDDVMLEVAVVAADDAALPADADPVLASETLEYALEAEAELAFEDQESDGESVVVDEVFLPEGGFVTVYDDEPLANDRLPEGLDEPTNESLRESVVGVSDYLEPGAHEDVEIELFDVPGVEFEAERLEAGEQLLVAVAFEETDGDGTFGYVETDGAEDGPYVDAEGAPVAEAALVLVDAEGTVAVELWETNAPVAVGTPLEITVLVANDGDGEAAETVSLALGGTTVDEMDVVLGPGEEALLTFFVDTTGLEPGAYEVTVASETDADETTVELEAAGTPSFATVAIGSAGPTGALA